MILRRRRDKMKREEFVQFVAKNIKYHLPSGFEDCQIEVGKHMGLTISEKNSPSILKIYLDEAYETFTQDRNIFPVMENIANKITQAWSEKEQMIDKTNRAIELVNDYDEAKKYLQTILRDPDFSNVPSDRIVKEMGSYVVLYQINMDNETEHVSIPVTDKLINHWEITQEQLYQDAIKVQASWNRPLLTDMVEMQFYLAVGGASPDNLLNTESKQIDNIGLYILTNEDLNNGAAIIIQEEVIRKVGDILQNNYYLLPSSRHELLIYPDNGLMTVKELQEMVQSVNSTEVSPEDQLSDKVLFYDQKERRLELATEREERLAEKSKETQKENAKSESKESSEKKENKSLKFTIRL